MLFSIWYQIFWEQLKQFIVVIGVICIIVDKCSQHVSFSVWSFSCYLHTYNTEWHHLYLTLHKVLSMIVHHLHKVLSEKDIQRAFLCWQRDSSPCTFSATTTVHHLHQVLKEKDGEMCSLFIKRKKINQTISDKWLLKIALHMLSPVIQSRYITGFQSVYMCIVEKR